MDIPAGASTLPGAQPPFPIPREEAVGTWHDLLLELAGRMPDSLLCKCREWLANGALDKLVQAVRPYATVQPSAWSAAGTAPSRSGLGSWATLNTGGRPLDHLFAPFAPSGMSGAVAAEGPCLDLTEPRGGTYGHAESSSLTDEMDAIAVIATESIRGALALWRAWRSPADGSLRPAPRRVHLLAVAAPTQRHLAAATLQRRLSASGEHEAQVEVFSLDQELPTYQRSARALSALLWTAQPGRPIRRARVYDHAALPGSAPGFSANRPLLTAPEATAVADYLERGALLMSTTTRLDDVLMPLTEAGRGVVPINFRTDGLWVWSDAIAYYTRTHRIAPIPELLTHVSAELSAGPRSGPDCIAVFRAIAALTRAEPDQGI